MGLGNQVHITIGSILSLFFFFLGPFQSQLESRIEPSELSISPSPHRLLN